MTYIKKDVYRGKKNKEKPSLLISCDDDIEDVKYI